MSSDSTLLTCNIFLPVNILSQSAFLTLDIISIPHFVPFDIMSHSAFLISTLCLFGVLSHSTFCPCYIFYHSTFCHSAFCLIRHFVNRHFYFRRLLLQYFVGELDRPAWTEPRGQNGQHDSKDRTAGTGQLRQDSQKKTDSRGRSVCLYRQPEDHLDDNT
jgi:hypothetical protein